MKCPECKAKTKVYDSRPHGTTVRRSRQCQKCNHRFITIEVQEQREKQFNTGPKPKPRPEPKPKPKPRLKKPTRSATDYARRLFPGRNPAERAGTGLFDDDFDAMDESELNDLLGKYR